MTLRILKKICHQINYRKYVDREISLLRKYLLRYKYDCYISPGAHIFHPEAVELSQGVYIHQNSFINVYKNSDLDITLSLGRGTLILPYVFINPQTDRITIGSHCSLNAFCRLYGRGGLTIGNDTRIGTGCVFLPMDHIYEDPGTLIRLQGETHEGIKIGNNVWFGADVKVLDGVTIGDGCVIGAGSVVTESIPPYSVAVGVPARIIEKRK